MDKNSEITSFSRLTSLRGEPTSLEDSPCIGNCSVTQWGDARCKGCGRHDYEIRDWSKYSPVDKKLINLRNADDGYLIRQLKRVKNS